MSSPKKIIIERIEELVQLYEIQAKVNRVSVGARQTKRLIIINLFWLSKYGSKDEVKHLFNNAFLIDMYYKQYKLNEHTAEDYDA